MSSLACFWQTLAQYGESPALSVDEQPAISYQELSHRISENIERWQTQSVVARPLILLALTNSVTSVIHYLSCLQLRWPAIVINPALHAQAVDALKQAFTPNWYVSDSGVTSLSSRAITMADSLALILSTSGSTGGGKSVALSYLNIQANCDSICEYLPIEQNDITLATLPFSYSYGLSVLNTHLAKGAQIVLTQHTVMDRDFWSLMKSLPVTSVAGVPHWYEMLLRLRFTRMSLPALRYLTQAGGRLAPDMVKEIAEFADNNQKAFYVMYGQTEATARMAFLNPQLAAKKPSAIGQAIPGGKLILRDEHQHLITAPDTEGELFYQGENVMLGYVENKHQLAAFENIDWLATGDVACRDISGDFTITGRKKRMIKVFGERVNLDGLEHWYISNGLNVKVCGCDNLIGLACLGESEHHIANLAREWVGCPPSAIRTFRVQSWPLLSSGKTDYQALNRLLAAM